MFKMFKLPLSVLINYRAVILRLYKVKIKNWTLENTPIIPLTLMNVWNARNAMELYGTLWNSMERYETLWNAMERYETLWNG